jgi:CTP:molybdopterin cytidylyltransferase MocA
VIHAVVLAAGLGTRFGPGGAKLQAVWRGQPLIAHVLSAVARARDERLIADGILVYGPGGDLLREAARAYQLDAVYAPRAAQGISESLKAGFAALDAMAPPSVTAALVCLGDQPAITLGTIRALVGPGAGPEVLRRPRYADEPATPGHPVLIGRRHWPLVDATTGDRGLDPVIAAKGLRWTAVPVAGRNPDVDTADDLRELP